MIDTALRPTMIDLTPQPAPMSFETWRCAGCGRIVAKHAEFRGTLQVKCRCGSMNTLTIR